MARALRTVALTALAAAGLGLAFDALAQTEAPAAEGQTAAPRQAQTQQAAKTALEAGISALQAGKADLAIQQLTAALSGGGLTPAQMARARYHRGIAFRKAGKPAQAIEDLTSALWFKDGLSAAERTDAVEQRFGAYRDAGLADQKGPARSTAEAAAAKESASPNTSNTGSTGFFSSLFGSGTSAAPPPAVPPPAAQTARPRWQTVISSAGESGSTAPAAALAPAAPESTSPSNPVVSLFTGWFGGGVSASAPPPREAAKAAVGWNTASIKTEPLAPAPTTAVSSWSVGTDVRPANKAKAGPQPAGPQPAGAARSPSPPAKPMLPAVAKGKFRLQVAAVRTRAEAQAVAQGLNQRHGAELGAREAVVEEAEVGNMGTFYHVRLGPFVNSDEPRDLCRKLRSDGLDCVLITH